VSRDEAGLRQGLTDALAARVHDPEGAGFSEAEQGLLRALRAMQAGRADAALEELRAHFEEGCVGQILHAFGLYRGLHTTMALIGAEILDDAGRPLSLREGFGVVTTTDGRFVPRDAFEASSRPR